MRRFAAARVDAIRMRERGRAQGRKL
jgi:hypothetical protein